MCPSAFFFLIKESTQTNVLIPCEVLIIQTTCQLKQSALRQFFRSDHHNPASIQCRRVGVTPQVSKPLQTELKPSAWLSTTMDKCEHLSLF